jgi:ribosome-associated heat shock protein Hsp15
MSEPSKKTRLDKWLWAARFFKTRSLAKQAIDGGKVQYDGAKSKVSKEVAVGAMISIRAGWDEKTVEVLALSDQRRGAPEAALLYKETDTSIAKREKNADDRKAAGGALAGTQGKPSKKDRRQIHRFINENHKQ